MAFFKFGKDTQDVTPKWAESKTRSDGKESITYGRSDGGSTHGHTVRGSDGKIEYSRSIGGKVRADDSKK